MGLSKENITRQHGCYICSGYIYYVLDIKTTSILV